MTVIPKNIVFACIWKIWRHSLKIVKKYHLLRFIVVILYIDLFLKDKKISASFLIFTYISDASTTTEVKYSEYWKIPLKGRFCFYFY